MHPANIVPTTSGFEFIDFNKRNVAPPVFDLAKLTKCDGHSDGIRLRPMRAHQPLMKPQSAARESIELGDLIAASPGYFR